MIKVIDKAEYSRIHESDLIPDQKAEMEKEIRDEITCIKEALSALQCPIHGSEECSATVHLRLPQNLRLYYDITDECCESILEAIPKAISPCLGGIHTDSPSD